MMKNIFLALCVLLVVGLEAHAGVIGGPASIAVLGATVIGVPNPILQTSQERKLFTSSFVQNTTDRWYSPDFPRSLYSRLVFRLSGTLSKTETGAGTLADNCLSLIRSIRVKADGDPIKEFEPSMLRVLSHHIFRRQDTNITNITLGTDAAEAFSARFVLDFQSPNTRLPEASLFPGNRYGELSLEVDWGAYTDLVSGGTYTGVSFPTNPTLEVWGTEHLDPALTERRYLIHKYFTKTFSQNATAENGKQFQLPVGEVYRGVLLKQMTRTPDLGIATLLAAGANIVVRANGSYRKIEATWAELVQRNQAQYGIALPTGYAYLDFMDDGDFNKAMRTGDAVGITNFEILADCSSVANAFLQVLGVTYKPARG